MRPGLEPGHLHQCRCLECVEFYLYIPIHLISLLLRHEATITLTVIAPENKIVTKSYFI
jgi:hypothetical protein